MEFFVIAKRRPGEKSVHPHVSLTVHVKPELPRLQALESKRQAPHENRQKNVRYRFEGVALSLAENQEDHQQDRQEKVKLLFDAKRPAMHRDRFNVVLHEEEV